MTDLPDDHLALAPRHAAVLDHESARVRIHAPGTDRGRGTIRGDEFDVAPARQLPIGPGGGVEPSPAQRRQARFEPAR